MTVSFRLHLYRSSSFSQLAKKTMVRRNASMLAALNRELFIDKILKKVHITCKDNIFLKQKQKNSST